MFVYLGVDQDNEARPKNCMYIAAAGTHQIWSYFLEDGSWLKKGQVGHSHLNCQSTSVLISFSRDYCTRFTIISTLISFHVNFASMVKNHFKFLLEFQSISLFTFPSSESDRFEGTSLYWGRHLDDETGMYKIAIKLQ